MQFSEIVKLILSLVGGISLFLFGMNIMGEALEKSAGNRLKTILGNLTASPIRGFFLGLGVTAVIQSSSATTVMLVGFVNSGLMTLGGAIPIIMGANVGTTVTAWLLSLTGIEGDSFFIEMLKPSSFTPILAVIGVVLYMFIKNPKKRDIGLILLGFSVLIFGMDFMSDAVRPLRDVPEFADVLLMFENPILGILMGAVVTAIIQSSSASVVFFLLTYFVSSPILNLVFIVLAIMSANGASSMLWSVYCPSLTETGVVSGATGFLDFLSYTGAAIANTVFATAATDIGWGNLILIWSGLMVLGVIVSLPFRGTWTKPVKENTVSE